MNNNTKKNTLLWCFGYITNKAGFVTSILIKVFSLMASFAGALYSSLMLAELSMWNEEGFTNNCIVLSLLIATRYLINTIYQLIENRIKRDTTCKVKEKLIEAVIELPFDEEEGVSYGKKIALINEDSFAVVNTIYSIIGYAFNLLSIVAVLFLIASKSIILALALLALCPTFYYVNKWMAKAFEKDAIELKKHSDHFNLLVRNIVGNENEVKYAISGKRLIKYTYSLLTKAKKLNVKYNDKRIIANSIGNLIEGSGKVLLCIAGGRLVLSQRIGWQFFLMIYLCAGYYFPSLIAIISSRINLQENEVSISRLRELLSKYENYKIIDRSKERFPAELKTIRLTDMRKSFGDRKVLSGLSMEAVSSEKVFVRGRNGAGKTTLLLTLARRYGVDEGSVEINGINVADISFSDFRKHVSYIGGSSFIIVASLRDNLILGTDKEINDADILAACTKVGFDDDLTKMKQGLDTEINEMYALSNGQLRKIQLARCILKSPQLLLADEAGAYLDKAALECFRNTFGRNDNGRIGFFAFNVDNVGMGHDKTIVLGEKNENL